MTCRFCSRHAVEAKGLLGAVLNAAEVPACGLHGDRALRSLDVKIRTPRFDEAEHPRDRRGRFIEVNARVSIFGGGSGVVQAYYKGGRVDVKRDGDGKVVRLDSGYLTVIAPKAGAAETDPADPKDATRNAQRTARQAGERLALPEDSRPDPAASPVGAALYWEGPDGKIAWMDAEQPPNGWMRFDAADRDTTYRFDNLGAFLVATGNNGLDDASLQKPAPTEDPAGAPTGAAARPAPGAPDPGDDGDGFDPLEGIERPTAGIDLEKAASTGQVIGLYKEGLPDYEGFGAWHLAYGAEGFDERETRRQAAVAAKVEVVADLTQRMAEVPDEDMMSFEEHRRLLELQTGNTVMLRGVKRNFQGEFMEGQFSDNFMPRAQYDALMAKDPDGLVRHRLTEVSADEWGEEKRTARVSGLVQAWALGSASNGRSIVLHETAAEVFGLTDTAEIAHEFYVSDRDVERVRDEESVSMRAFVLAQYEATQDYFRERGITHLPVYRGHKVYDERTPEWAVDAVDGGRGVADVTLRPVSSFSVDRDVAAQFARGTSTDESYIITGTVPVARVLATPRTGVGSLEEAEVVVLGGPGTWQVERATEADGPLVDDEYDPQIDGAGPEGDDFYDEDDDVPPDEMIQNTPAGAIATRADMLTAIRLADTDARKQALATRAATLGLSELIPADFPPAA